MNVNSLIFKKLIKKTPVKIAGSSMLPLFGKDNIVYFDSINKRRLQINDIVFVKKSKDFFVHRIIYKNSDYFITRGDNNLKSDGKIKHNQIIAKVKKIKKGKNTYTPENIYLLQSAYYFKEILKIKKLFEMNNVSYVFLKGLPLHLYFEGNHPRRLYTDCDVLIGKKDFDKAKKILSQSGYENNNTSFSPIQRKLKDKVTESSFFKIINGIPVVFDIHLEPVFLMTQIGSLNALYPQNLINRLTIALLETKREIIINDEKFFILNSKFLILYLALHFFHHNFRGAFRLDFLDKVIRKSHLKKQGWINIKTTVDDYSLENFVKPVFFLLKKYYSTPVPDFMLTKGRSAFGRNFNNLDIFSDKPRFETGVNRFKNIFFLSPRPFIIKLLVFFDPQVIYLVFFVLKKKLSRFLKAVLENH